MSPHNKYGRWSKYKTWARTSMLNSLARYFCFENALINKIPRWVIFFNRS